MLKIWCSNFYNLYIIAKDNKYFKDGKSGVSIKYLKENKPLGTAG